MNSSITIFNQPLRTRIRAQQDETGQITDWQQGFVSAPIIFGLVPPSLSWAVDTFAADKGTARGAISAYDCGNRRIEYSDIRLDIPTGPWRGLGSAPLVFANETMMDELSHQAGLDPVFYRLKHLGSRQKRLARMIRQAARMSGWGRKLPKGHGLGIAAAKYKEETAVAIVAEVSTTEDEYRVEQIWCAQDSGQVIDEDAVRNQIEGNIAWGCGMAISEAMRFEGYPDHQQNFDTYEILRLEQMPEVSIHLAEHPDERPLGVGESALGPVAPAIGNALFNATGFRTRELPFRTPLNRDNNQSTIRVNG